MTRLEEIEKRLSYSFTEPYEFCDDVKYLLDRLKEAEEALREQNRNWRDDNHISENYFSKWEPKE